MKSEHPALGLLILVPALVGCGDTDRQLDQMVSDAAKARATGPESDETDHTVNNLMDRVASAKGGQAALFRGLDSSNPAIREVCIDEFGAKGDRAALPRLCQLAESRDPSVGFDSLLALMKINDQGAGPTYKRILAGSPLLRGEPGKDGFELVAFNAVAKLNDRSATPVLIPWLGASKLYTTAAETLGEVGD